MSSQSNPVRKASGGRTPLFNELRRLLALAALANRAGGPREDELPELHREKAISRRESLRELGTAFGAAAVVRRKPQAASVTRPPARSSGRSSPVAPQIAVVGGGIAGLRATYALKKAGVAATLYTAEGKLGGRIQSVTNLVAPGVTTELGGEFIDSDHDDVLSLVSEFGLDLYDVASDPLPEAYFFRGRHHSAAEVIAAYRPLAARIAADADNVPDNVSYLRPDPFSAALDRISIEEYLLRAGVSGWLFDLIGSAYLNEDGMDIGNQSSLNLVTTIGTDLRQGFHALGSSDERYKVKGGNARIIDGLSARVADRVSFGQILEAINPQGTGYRLTFASPNGPSRDVYADFVILALPFSFLRSIWIGVPMPSIKQRVIRELGYGTNTKLLLGTTARPWRTAGYGGNLFTDLSLSSGWDHSRGQSTGAGGYTIFQGGSAGIKAGEGTSDQLVAEFLPGLDHVFPGTAAHFNGRTARACWPNQPFARGSYSDYAVGQYVGLGGAQALPVGNLYFAGEHCDHPDLGYMNGAARTGLAAANAVLSRVRH